MIAPLDISYFSFERIATTSVPVNESLNNEFMVKYMRNMAVTIGNFHYYSYALETDKPSEEIIYQETLRNARQRINAVEGIAFFMREVWEAEIPDILEITDPVSKIAYEIYDYNCGQIVFFTLIYYTFSNMLVNCAEFRAFFLEERVFDEFLKELGLFKFVKTQLEILRICPTRLFEQIKVFQEKVETVFPG
jgi:hypothetical protein